MPMIEEEREFPYGSLKSIESRLRQIERLTGECDASTAYKVWAACREISIGKEISPSEADKLNAKVRSNTLKFAHNCSCTKQ